MQAQSTDQSLTQKIVIGIATLAGGCFWCLDAVFAELKGVIDVESGYAGGHVDNPTYAQVCGGQTGHAEVVRIVFDQDSISYEDILKIFFVVHDATTLNRQGADVGTQYRSAIFYHSQEQKETAEKLINEMTDSQVFASPIVTEVAPLKNYFAAEDYHQQYYIHHPYEDYCTVVIAPKLAKFREKFATYRKPRVN
ncbi:peptide-methionine (S)-S-oxide reductase MsrA [Ampullimonas aquatilis]|uniref:peptide-methionine (S)-S-oxide reductase MsrA n=1 Tax=Ampullimonas aquatilis TaxID=1341549 RepID=UPI003C76DF8B